jgi:molybdopterin molybdotransferase
VRDDPRRFRAVLARALRWKPDTVITTGAVSMGKHDFVTGEVRRLGAKILYHKVAIRPGKPGLVARLPNGPVLFGLPGNPVSTVVGWRFFVLPHLRRRLGLPPAPAQRLRLVSPAPKPEGLRCFFKARREAGGVRVLPGQSSHQISPLLAADCWAVLPERGALTRARTLVEVHPL